MFRSMSLALMTVMMVSACAGPRRAALGATLRRPRRAELSGGQDARHRSNAQYNLGQELRPCASGQTFAMTRIQRY